LQFINLERILSKVYKDILMENIEKNIGYTFQSKKLLNQALTHSSVTADIHKNYERLEFLGDRILGLTIADMLCTTFIDEPEGSLAQRFVRLVCKETVAEVVRNLGIPKHINAINKDVCSSDNVLCDVGEALIAAIYLDSHNLNTSREFIRRNWLPLIDKKSQPQKDYKTFLQEKAAILNLPAPQYRLIEKAGPEHAPTFMTEVSIGIEHRALGQGSNKKHSEQEAASAMLKLLGETDVI